jgi:peptide/nickel transport system substrate-binding protein
VSVRRAVVATTCLLLTACAERESPPPTLVVAMPGDVESWNPYAAESAVSREVLALIYPRLFESGFDGRGVTLRPSLATSSETSADGRRLTLRVRTGATWSDGSPIVCEDVAFTYRAQTSDELAWTGAYLKEGIEEVACDDEGRVIVTLREPSATALLDVNDDEIVPRAYADVPFEAWRATRWDERVVAGGPFALERHDPGQRAMLRVRRDHWQRPTIDVERVEIRVVPDRALAVRQLLAGSLDVVTDLPPGDAARVARSEVARVVDAPSLDYTAIVWNALEPGAYAEDRARRGCDDGCDETADDLRRLAATRAHPVLGDARVRRALSFAIDRADLVAGLLHGYGRPGTTPVVSALAEHADELETDHDPRQAARLLDEAGWNGRGEDGIRRRDGRRLEIRVLVNAANALRRDALGRISASLRGVGVALEPVPLARREFGARVRGRDFDGVILGWRAGTRVEPHAILHTRAALDGGNNFGSWSTPASDALMDEARTTLDRERARRSWRAWQRLFLEEQPMAVLFEERRLVGVASRVVEATPDPTRALWGLHGWRVDTSSEGTD